MKQRIGDILGIIIFPFVAIAFIIISPVLLLTMYINYKRGEKNG